MGNVKQAHTVPTFYLDSFSGSAPKGQVWTYDKTLNKRWSAKPENTGKQGYFYAVNKEDGTKDLTIENYLSNVETKAKPGYEMLLQGNIPDGQVRADFATYVALQFMRTTSMRQRWAESYCKQLQQKMNATIADKEAFDQFMEKEALETGIVVTDAKKEKIRLGLSKPSNFILQVPQEMTMSALLPADSLMEAIYNMDWSVGHTINKYFITSDNPVAAYSNEAFIRSGASPKDIHYHEDSMLDFPISPESILVMGWRKMKENFTVSDTRIDKANEERAIRANRFIYAHINDDVIGQLSFQHSQTKWGLNADEQDLEMPKVAIERA